MFSGKLACCRILRQLKPTRTLNQALLLFFASKNRYYSSKPDLFTLDFDFENDGNITVQDTTKDTSKTFQKSQKHDILANDSKITDKGDISSAGAEKMHDEVSSTNQREELDILADIMFDSPKDKGKNEDELTSLFGDLFSQTLNGPTQDFEQDLADFDMDGSEQLETGGMALKQAHVLADEKELFEKIFATYSQPDASLGAVDKLQNQVLANLQESFSTVNKSVDPVALVQSFENLSERESTTIEKNTHEALEHTLKYIEELATREDVVGFARGVFDGFQHGAFREKSFYLHKRKRESSKAYLARHKELSDSTKAQSEATPEKPVLNVFTMPVLFNKVISVLCTKHYDGALALTLFNLVKEDLNLYTVVCNQRTYNEILKVYWVFFGKRSLCEIELVVVEMMNNGFAGDNHTFVILKEILSTYYSMKMGQSSYNPGGIRIWSKEDEKRARNLMQKLTVLGKQLQKERFFGQGLAGNSNRYR